MRREICSLLPAIGFVFLTASCAPMKTFEAPAVPKIPDLGKDADKALEAARDTLAPGGQPGQIKLNGVIAKLARVGQGQDSALQVSAQTGIGWRGTKPGLKVEASPTFSDDVSSDARKAVNATFATRALSFGCSPEVIKNYVGDFDPSAVKLDKDLFNESIKVLSAQTVLLCGNNPLSALALISITASEVILVNTSLNLAGSASLSIQTAKLSWLGRNAVRAAADDGQITIGDGPSISITVADALTVSGTLSIAASGSNYKK